MNYLETKLIASYMMLVDAEHKPMIIVWIRKPMISTSDIERYAWNMRLMYTPHEISDALLKDSKN